MFEVVVKMWKMDRQTIITGSIFLLDERGEPESEGAVAAQPCLMFFTFWAGICQHTKISLDELETKETKVQHTAATIPRDMEPSNSNILGTMSLGIAATVLSNSIGSSQLQPPNPPTPPSPPTPGPHKCGLCFFTVPFWHISWNEGKHEWWT